MSEEGSRRAECTENPSARVSAGSGHRWCKAEKGNSFSCRGQNGDVAPVTGEDFMEKTEL